MLLANTTLEHVPGPAVYYMHHIMSQPGEGRTAHTEQAFPLLLDISCYGVRNAAQAECIQSKVSGLLEGIFLHVLGTVLSVQESWQVTAL